MTRMTGSGRPESTRPVEGERTDADEHSVRTELAGRSVLLIAVVTTALLVVSSGRYGYHRDELYFLAAGRHPAWSYPDQPPLTPLIARLMSAIAPDSLVVLRLPAALAAAATVLLTGALAREFGAGRAGQMLAAACVGFSGSTFAIFHTLSTTAFDVLCWTLVSFLLIRQLRGADSRGWLLVGLALGVALQNKTLIAFLVLALLIGLLGAGPRSVLCTPWFYAGGLLALLIAAPVGIWQAGHGWPQLALSRSIAAGGSTSSQPWYLFLPFQILLYSPLYVPIWAVGWWRLLRLPALRRFRCFAIAFALLAVLFLVTGGKPYYLAGLYPVLLAAGAQPAVAWAWRGRGVRRRGWLVAAVSLSLLITGGLMLPVWPATWLQGSPMMAVNPDVGETVGWPRLVATVGTVYSSAPPGSVVLTRNYGEAGAIDRFGPALGLPRAFSGHNAYGLWGPPLPSARGSAVVIGYSADQLSRWFASCRPGAVIDDGVGLDNQEQGRTVYICSGLRGSWAEIWPQLVRLG